jgi:hypothetical protein
VKMMERYNNDPLFRTFVDTMVAAIERGQTTPCEVREAAMLAQIIYEDRNPRPLIFKAADVFSGKV